MSLRGERIRLLSMVDVFEPLSAEEIGRLDKRLPDAHLETGDIFYSPDDPSEKVFILRRGKARIYKVAEDGREFTLAVVEAGTMFGEMTLMAQRLQGAYAQAMEPSEVSMMLRQDLERLILEKPQVGLQMAHLLSERLRRYEIRLEDITLKDVPTRLASMILLLVEAEGVVTSEGYIRIPTHYTHQQLGSMIGTNREAVSRAFGVLQEETIVELRRRIIYVKNLEALKRRAGHAQWSYGKDPNQTPTKDEVLDDISLYWLTNTATSAARFYWENRNENLISTAAQKTDEITLPVAITAFPNDDLYRPPETWARRAFPNLIYFHEAERGGHFPAWEEPDVFATEVRAAFRSLR